MPEKPETETRRPARTLRRLWRVVRSLGPNEEVFGVGIVSADTETVAFFFPDDERTANRVVDAVNHLEPEEKIAELRAALFRTTEALNQVWKHSNISPAMRETVEDAIRAGDAALCALRRDVPADGKEAYHA